MKSQRGGFALGMVVGLLTGLVLALGVALYVTKVPIPFVDKVPQRTAEQDAADAERIKRWDPNAPLTGKPAVKVPETATAPPATPAPATTPSPAPLPAPVPAAPPPTAQAPARPASAAEARTGRDPAAILAGAPVGAPNSKSTTSSPDAFRYFVQTGAYSRTEDAEQQRAKLALLGFAAQITEREQSGRTVYRVRLGPYDKKDVADATQAKLKESEFESALVRVERTATP